MNRTIFIVMLLFLVACSTKKNEKKERQKYITVSILPQKTFVEKIAGNDFEVNVLIPPGTSPAIYSLTPQQMSDIARSDIWFRIGYIGFELSWKEKIEQAAPEMKVVDLSEGLDLIAQQRIENGKEVVLKGVDPHTWLSPALVKAMAKRILKELTELYPREGVKYKTNYEAFVKEIDSLDTQIKSKLDSVKTRRIITFHPVLTYFARDYGLEQLSLESGGKEPTPMQLKSLIDIAKNENIKTIYIQSELDKQQAQVFAEETGGNIIQIRPLDPNWSTNLLEITNTIIHRF